MLLSRAETVALLRTDLPLFQLWHRDGYKRGFEVRMSQGRAWDAQDAATQAKFVTNLVKQEAALACPPGRQMLELGFKAYEVTNHDRVAALLRFRRVELSKDLYGETQPAIPGVISPTAERWFGNAHLADPRQGVLGETSPARPPTNLLLGHTADRTTGELRRVVIACFLGSQIQWWFDVENEMGSLVGAILPSRLPTQGGLVVTPKARPGSQRSMSRDE